MWGTRTKIARRPHGVVFVIGAFNYPLFLPGVQILQALAAGNAVLFKPAPGAEACGAALVDLIRDAGIPKGLLQCLPVDSEFARQTIREGVELVVLTGSSKTGRAVLREAAERLTPVVAELSGCDAMFIFNGADLDLVRSAINFGLTFNSSATCIAPRRMIVEAAILPDVIARLQSEPAGPRPTLAVHRGAIEQVIGLVADAVRRGGQVWPEDQWNPDRLCESGRMSPILILGCQPQWPIAQADLFAPLLSVIACPDRAAMLAADQHCPYALGASIFGPREEAGQFARQLGAGAVTINDLIVPTADPRVPFGGSGESGFGVTRGPEGLLAMTRPQAIMDRKHGPRFHLQPPSEDDAKLLDGMLRFQHAPSWRERWRGLRTVIQVSRQRPKQP
jgi:aldehyde dehydrogenase (NAD+)